MIKDVDQIAEECRARLGHGPLTTSAWTARRPNATDVRIFDDVLADPDSYRLQALSLPYTSVTVGGATFHGIAQTSDPFLPLWIAATYPSARPTLTFFRRSPAFQIEPNFVHTDRDMGDWTAILYLTPHPPDSDGTTFWEHEPDGGRASTASTDEMFHDEWTEWRQRSAWREWLRVEAKWNRLIIFPAPLFHSRSLYDNYGEGVDARLTQLMFGTGSEMWGQPCA